MLTIQNMVKSWHGKPFAKHWPFVRAMHASPVDSPQKARLGGALIGPLFAARNLIRHDDIHDDVIKWKHFPRYWPFVREIHRSPVNFPHKGQWRRALMFTLICARINGWVNNREVGDLRRYRAHYDVIVMYCNGYISNKVSMSFMIPCGVLNMVHARFWFDIRKLVPVQLSNTRLTDIR